MDISKLRYLLRFTQTDLARLLRVKRSVLAMFETGGRALPKEASDRWTFLTTQLARVAMADSDTISIPPDWDVSSQLEAAKVLLNKRTLRLKKMLETFRDFRRSGEEHQLVRETLKQFGEKYPDAALALPLYDELRNEPDSDSQSRYLEALRLCIEARAWVDFLESPTEYSLSDFRTEL